MIVYTHSLTYSFTRAQNPQSALTLFEQIHHNYPTSPVAQYHYAKALDHLAELNRSNQLLQNAINEYQKYLELDAVLNDNDFKMAAERCIDRMRFIGMFIHVRMRARTHNFRFYRIHFGFFYPFFPPVLLTYFSF